MLYATLPKVIRRVLYFAIKTLEDKYVLLCVCVSFSNSAWCQLLHTLFHPRIHTEQI